MEDKLHIASDLILRCAAPGQCWDFSGNPAQAFINLLQNPLQHVSAAAGGKSVMEGLLEYRKLWIKKNLI